MNVHEIVHGLFFPSIRTMHPVRALVYGVIKFGIFGIFVNNWAILIFICAFLKCYERSV